MKYHVRKGGKTNDGISTFPVPPLSHAEVSPWGHKYFGYSDQREIVLPEILPKLPNVITISNWEQSEHEIGA